MRTIFDDFADLPGTPSTEPEDCDAGSDGLDPTYTIRLGDFHGCCTIAVAETEPAARTLYTRIAREHAAECRCGGVVCERSDGALYDAASSCWVD